MSAKSNVILRPVKNAVKRGAVPTDEKIYNAILKAVMNQRLPPGTKMTEASLCELFSVSRTVVRKALQRLAHDHILDIRPNRGASVAQPSPQETRDIFATRRAIEAAIIPLAIARATPIQIARLRQVIVDEHQAYHAQDYPKWIRLGGDFHILLAEVAGNTVMIRFLLELVSRCSLIIALYQSPETNTCPNDEHHRLVDAIATGDTALACRLMDSHLRDIESALRLKDEETELDLAKILELS